MMTGNKGEWSEIYVFLRLLDTGRLYAADEDLNKQDSVFYHVLQILREEKVGTFKFSFFQAEQMVEIYKDDVSLLKLSSNKFMEEANKLFTDIKESNGASFSIEDTETFLTSIHIDTLKAKSTSKSDISLKIHDINSGYEAIQGFSIKSRLGGASTLINAGKTTNFIYHLENIDKQVMEVFNEVKHFKDKFSVLKEHQTLITYHSMENVTFENNLRLIDSCLPEICGELLLEFFKNGNTTTLSAVDSLTNKNTLNYNLTTGHPFYSYKFKKLLTECALGMLPSKTWNGVADATGGYIIVREDGEVLCYHIFNRNEFENYLLKNTKFETASTSRHGFGNIYEENGVYKLKLNMQVRFIK